MLFASRRKKYRYYTFYNSSLFACVFFPKICLLRQKNGLQMPEIQTKKPQIGICRSAEFNNIFIFCPVCSLKYRASLNSEYFGMFFLFRFLEINSA